MRGRGGDLCRRGLLDIRNGVIDAQTVSPALVADGATLTAYELTVTGSQSGLELTPGAGPASSLSAVTLIGSEQPVNFGPRAIGLLVRAAREYGRLEVQNAKICGYVEGVVVEGASVGVSNSRVCKADKGLVLYNGELSLTDSRVRATTGVAAASGRAVIRDNVFSGVRDVIYAEQRAVIEASGNRVWSRYDICRPRFDPRWRDRYAPPGAAATRAGLARTAPIRATGGTPMKAAWACPTPTTPMSWTAMIGSSRAMAGMTAAAATSATTAIAATTAGAAAAASGVGRRGGTRTPNQTVMSGRL